MITCAKCGKENQDHYKFCLGCGAELPRDASPKPYSPKTPPQGVKQVAPPAPPPYVAPAGPPPPAAPPIPPPAPVPVAQAHAPAMPPRPSSAGVTPQPFAPPAPPPVAAATASTQKCPTCGHDNPMSVRFCNSCGTPLAAVAAPAATPMPAFVAPPAPAAPAMSPVAPPLAQPIPAAVVPTANSSRFSLTALRADGSDAGSYTLPDGTTIIGRDLGGIFGGDSYLSPKHATFRAQNGKLFVRDEHSLNGVYVKIARDNPIEVRPGDIFRIGQEIIRFERLQTPTPAGDGVERLGSPAEGIVGRIALITGRETTGNAFTVPAHGIHMGRERGDVTFPEDGYVSGLHCRILPDGGRFFLTDLGSSNGTYVRFGDEREVKGGDILLMGQQLFRVGG